ncbi:hypothetical protein BaRGS_00034258 [Batillaria attramentaria]|uniref:Uncharacterized protein n=1 Tax=Batillaria attramentaria TaxID=370345 RepID=A0ABD0JHW2_9CAEN
MIMLPKCCKCESKSCDAETCNCLCLEIRLRPPPDKVTEFSSNVRPTPEPRPAWELAPNLPSHNLHYPVPRAGGNPELMLDLDWARSSSRRSQYSTRSGRQFDSGRCVSEDLVATSTPRHHYGRVEVYNRPGVYSNGRVGLRRQSPRRRSTSRSRSPHSRRSSRVLPPRRSYSRSSEHLSHTNDALPRRLFMTPPSTLPY